ncbi:DUF1573 domain-containing protein [Pedobacter flavus]|uniref:DUF1573 domain-containing protein n=1 Tax=Pedobacter flavus TaxID=3113906 RepID=A0ABU7H1L9_9SPHI|nr:DUF1573 domain-containing protein [Pedobacter sp. VNH31]MEE1885229.1 DUF1573 domain-containing protein [Pedobacter sp. VNH31]
MKSTFLLFLSVILLSACNSADKKNSSSINDADKAVILFENEMHNFGSVAEGTKVTHTFNFKNTGKSPLIIEDASASCGCTVPEYSNNPIQPGQSGVIKVVFDTQGRAGLNDKVITVLSNATEESVKLHLVGEVKLNK